MKKIITFIKNEIVFIIACILALISMFFVPPSAAYIDYIDFRTLSLLLALMLVVQGLKSCGLFDILATTVMHKATDQKQLALLLVLLCFFGSMLITNDVALITFVPFTIMLLEQIDNPYYSIYLIVLETIAANLGSMFTPIGNPQNLYLYSISGMDIGHFLLLMLPYSALSLILLIVAVGFIKPDGLKVAFMKTKEVNKKPDIIRLLIYILLFVICLLTVLHVLDYRIMLGIVLFFILLTNYRLIPRADYILLLTFIAFFIFIGNLKQMESVENLLATLVDGRECLVSIIASQAVSNVPCAMLLSGFTDNYNKLIIGTNLGGLGTLIASMASLISFKFYAKMDGSSTKRYIDIFTGMNVLFLIVLFIFYTVLN